MPWAARWWSSSRTALLAVPQVLTSFGRLFQRAATLDVQGAARSDDVGGPIRTVTFLRAALESGQILQFAALVNLSLAFFNLLPIPGLDGGRVLLVVVQALARRPLSFELENGINFAGFAFVMLIMMFVILSDVVRLF
ncbi:site-2 protease family protein [Deinococcus pimensis]|uniref:site-2 protease family protein n=1 Tax=Deinococcus pimensis TaxID=309888 RepID=UPI00048665D4|nr:site-2 protease family protein [Deinococcus pimensis]